MSPFGDKVNPNESGCKFERRIENKFRDSSMVEHPAVIPIKSGCKFERRIENKFRDSSMVEHPAVNRRVASSSLARGANIAPKQLGLLCFYALLYLHIKISNSRKVLYRFIGESRKKTTVS